MHLALKFALSTKNRFKLNEISCNKVHSQDWNYRNTVFSVRSTGVIEIEH